MDLEGAFWKCLFSSTLLERYHSGISKIIMIIMVHTAFLYL